MACCFRASTAPPRSWSLDDYNMDELLGKVFYFFECQESGKLRLLHRVKWRGDSYLRDGEASGMELAGGWHDAGGGGPTTGIALQHLCVKLVAGVAARRGLPLTSRLVLTGSSRAICPRSLWQWLVAMSLSWTTP
jgi:Glycosyl hydrolase family 9